MKNFFKKLGTKEFWKWFALSFIYVPFIAVVLDASTKWIANLTLKGVSFPGQQVIPGFAYFWLQYNTGASWSFLANLGVWGRIILLAVSIIMSAVLLFFFISKFKVLNTLYRLGLTLMAGGAIGNLIDRALYWEAIVGHDGVIDFLSFHIPYYHIADGKWTYYLFPTFNVADSCLTIGTIVLLVAVVIDLVKDSIAKAKRGEYKYSPKELEKMRAEQEAKEKENPVEKVEEIKVDEKEKPVDEKVSN